MIRSGGIVTAVPSKPVGPESYVRAARLEHVPRSARAARLALLASALPVVALVALSVGSVHVPLGDVWSALLHPRTMGPAHVIVIDLRLPRVLIAMGVGAGLGLAGALLQALFRNPLVDPFITGVSAGAALAAATGFVLGLTFAFIPALAFCGGIACAAIVAAIGAADSPSGNLRLVLAGVAVSALASAAPSRTRKLSRKRWS